MFIFIREKELKRDPDAMVGRRLVQARFAIFAGIYPDFYGWRHYYFVLFLWIIHPGLYSYFVMVYVFSFIEGLRYMDVELLGQVLCLGTITVIYCFVSIYFIAKKTDLDELMVMAGKGLSNYSRPKTQKENTILNSKEKSTYKYAIGSTIMFVSVSLLHMGFVPILRGLRGQYSSITNDTAPINKYTPLPVWTPYECNDLSTFLVSYFTQLIPGCMELSIINACCILYIGLCQQLSGNLEILASSLRELPERVLYMFEAERGTVEKFTPDLYQNEHFLRCLNTCIGENIEHQYNIIKFYKKIQGVFGFSILAIFSGTGLIISCAAYTMLLIAEREKETEVIITNTFVWSFNLFVYTFLLTMYCYYGQIVTDKNDEIHEALYDTPWIEGDMPFRKSVIIAMSYSQLNMTLSAMGLVGSSLATLLDIIKTSFSYLNMLLAAR